MLDFLIDVFESNPSREAIVWKDNTYSYEWLLQRFHHWNNFLDSHSVSSGEVVILEADFSPEAVALFLALVQRRNILVPLTTSVEAKKSEFIQIACGQVIIKIDQADQVSIES